MRYLVLSDVHGNFAAWTEALALGLREGFDTLLLLGDLVGYGPEPNEVIEAVRCLEAPLVVVRGNHDKVVAGIEDGSDFNGLALAAAEWTREALTADNLEYLRDLPEGPIEAAGGLEICHGAPHDEDLYLLSALDAAESLTSSPARLTFFGHTHLPTAFSWTEAGVKGGVLFGESGSLALKPDWRYLINPGSVGQPRDRDARASFILYDGVADLVTWHRVDYAWEGLRSKVEAAGLPVALADRLALGI